jgi:acetyl esterase/lipase
MKKSNRRRLVLKTSAWFLASVLGTAGAWADDAGRANAQKSVVDDDGTVHLPAVTVPFSSLASEEARRHFVAYVRGLELLATGKCGSMDDCLVKPVVKRLEASFPVKITQQTIAGIRTDIVVPAGGVSAKNANRILINLHSGGYYLLGGGPGAQMESIPVASLGAIKVVSVDYRLGPQNKFPAASEDVASVYRELLKQYRPGNIGIYGCSAGGILSAQAVAWFQTHNLPRPGAIGMFGAGGTLPVQGDSNYVNTPLMGPAYGPKDRHYPEDADGFKKLLGYFDGPGIDLKDPLVSPAFYPSVLAAFPPTLLITGTRDANLSGVVYTHAQLVKAGADADLHVWEGAHHCSFAGAMVDADVPETREALDVIVKFFDKHLGK